MRAVLQRVSRARITVAGSQVARIDGPGLLALIAATHTDDLDTASRMARKIAELRILDDERSVLDLGGSVLVVSQFTLYGQTRKGRRPSWSDAAPPELARPLVDRVAAALKTRGLTVAVGVFGAVMSVDLVNEGPFTLLVEV
ncbi:MAG TPA: D-aminoacyl-tRNA deacylase [Dermatophilaceae bacterium]|nr:D-aminoacyl-tRNA deacylase [Dermatophilaceae bacterium]